MKRQRIMIQTREREKNPENQLSDLEITNLLEKDFRLMIVKMIQDVENKLEEKADKLQETPRKKKGYRIKQAKEFPLQLGML